MKINESKSITLLLVAWLVLVTLMYLVGVFLAKPAHAEWVSIDRFKGLITHESGDNIPVDAARYIDGWQVRNGGLERAWYTKWATADVTPNPAYIIGSSGTGNSLLVFLDALYRLKLDTLREVGFAASTQTDSAQAVNGTDSILTSFENARGSYSAPPTTGKADSSFTTPGVRWLNYALTNKSDVNWNGTPVGILNFYSNRWALANEALTVQTVGLAAPLSIPNVSSGTGILDYVDTTLIMDGDNFWIYEGDLDTVKNSNSTLYYPPPVYQTAGTNVAHVYDTLRVLNTIELGAGDTVLAIRVNPDDSLNGGDFTRFWVLMDDTLSTSQCVPCSVASADVSITDSVLLTLLCDSTRYANTNHYWGRVEGSGSPLMYAILYRPGARTDVTPTSWFMYDTTSGSTRCWPPPYSSSFAPLVKIQYLGHWGLLHYAKIEMVAGDVHLPFSSTLMSKKARITDCDIFEIVSDGAGAANPDTVQIVCIGYSANTKQGHFSACTPSGTAWPHYFTFLAFSKDTIKPSDFVMGSVYMQAYNRPRVSGWSTVTSNSTPSKYSFATLHRNRAFYGGDNDPDTAAHVGYSEASTATGNYFHVLDKTNRLYFEGSDYPVGLSSMGASLAIYFRRKIILNSGYAEANFYAQPAPVGIGAVNHWSIARSPRHNQDVLTNENGIFFFNGSGLEPLTDQITEIFSDSVNWDEERDLRAACWDNMYFVTMPIGSATSNTNTVGLDLETRDAWISSAPRAASIWNWKHLDGSEELFIGDADSSVLWQANGPRDEFYYTSDWRSGWTDLGDGSSNKLVAAHKVEYSASSAGDTIIVNWYKNFTDTAVWADTIVSGAAGNNTYVSQVSRVVQGAFLSYGIQSSDSAAAVNRFAFDWRSLGGKRR